jgi:regulator of RNase E activity RraA
MYLDGDTLKGNEMNQELLERAKRIATATLGDALDFHGIDGVMSGIERRSGSGRTAGFAQTMHEHVAPFGTFKFADFTVGQGFDAIEPHAVLVVDMAGADVSTFGGLASLAATTRQAEAVIIDGACRDVEEIRASGLTVASRSVTPRTGKGRLRVVSLGKPVGCGGVRVRPGDLVVADDTGIVVIPIERAEEVLTTAEDLDRRDTVFAGHLREGLSFAEIAKKLQHA